MNLVFNAWLPFLLRDGSVRTLPMTELNNPSVIDFALPRADLQSAAYQFAIGLLQTTTAPDDYYHWMDMYEQAPSDLSKVFEPVNHAFNVIGDDALFMQDFDLPSKHSVVGIAGVVYGTSVGNALKCNTDLFNHRGEIESLSLEMAALALFARNQFAGSDGVGYRTSIRGGGPLTTLVQHSDTNASLWQRLWLNVINRDHWRYDDPVFDGSVFPWLAPTVDSTKGAEVTAADMHPLHVFWGMPRRMRLVVGGAGHCDILGSEHEVTVREFRTTNYGNNYSEGLHHPLTPYSWDVKKQTLPNPRKGGIYAFSNWHLLTLASSENGFRCADVITHYHQLCDRMGDELPPVSLHACGLNLDNAKLLELCDWHLPLVAATPAKQESIYGHVKVMTELYLKSRAALSKSLIAAIGSTKTSRSMVDSQLEPAFYELVSNIINGVCNGETINPDHINSWYVSVRRVMLEAFDVLAFTSDIPTAETVAARKSLTKNLHSKWVQNLLTEYGVNNED